MFALNCAVARPITPAERTALTDTVARFDAAMRGTDLEAIAQTVPPKVLDHIAKQANVTVEQLRTTLIDQIKTALAADTIDSFKMDLAEAEFLELPDGKPYVLIPTETVVKTESGKMAVGGKTLAFMDGDSWYLVRVSEPQQVNILRAVYPEFATIEMPEGTMKAVQ
nr:hypothetical protein [Oryzicola mucosus]